jgi:hypothetical protein
MFFGMLVATVASAADAQCVFSGARLFNETGHKLGCADLGGMAVALCALGSSRSACVVLINAA